MTAPPQASRAPAAARQAATMMLLREGRGGVEVLVIRRHQNLAFMGGMWVFPGGALSPADTSPESLARIPQRSRAHCPRLHDLNGNALEEPRCLGLAVAAYRETFEETGVLLATSAEGEYCRNDLPDRVQEQRRAIVSHPELFARLLDEQRLFLDIGRLTCWAHWITPSGAPRRFDTRFFAVRVPPGQTAAIDTIEAVEHAWMSPAALLAAAATGAMSVSQPTLYNLMDLDASLRLHGSLQAMLSATARRPIVPVLPKLILGRAPAIIVMPWDPEYPQLAGEGAPPHVVYPPWMRELPSRIST